MVRLVNIFGSHTILLIDFTEIPNQNIFRTKQTNVSGEKTNELRVTNETKNVCCGELEKMFQNEYDFVG